MASSAALLHIHLHRPQARRPLASVSRAWLDVLRSWGRPPGCCACRESAAAKQSQALHTATAATNPALRSATAAVAGPRANSKMCASTAPPTNLSSTKTPTFIPVSGSRIWICLHPAERDILLVVRELACPYCLASQADRQLHPFPRRRHAGGVRPAAGAAVAGVP